jgi:hypothetical protein
MVHVDDVEFRSIQRVLLHVAVEAVDQQVLAVDALDIPADLERPGRRILQLVTRLPAEDGLVVLVQHAGNRIAAIEDVGDRRLEVGDQLGVGPERVRILAAELGVVRPPAHPLPVVDQRHDDANPVFVRQREREVHRAERLLVEFARRLDVGHGIGGEAAVAHGYRVAPDHAPAHLRNRGVKVAQLELRGQAVGIGLRECHLVLDVQQCRYVEGNEAEFLAAVHQPRAVDRDEMLEFGPRRRRQRGHGNGQHQDRDQDRAFRAHRHSGMASAHCCRRSASGQPAREPAPLFCIL